MRFSAPLRESFAYGSCSNGRLDLYGSPKPISKHLFVECVVVDEMLCFQDDNDEGTELLRHGVER